MSLLKTILTLLADGQFHSEEEIGRLLGLASSSIPNTLQQLLESDVQLENNATKGYRIPGGLELLDASLIYNELGQLKPILKNLEILDSINSTNTYLLEKETSLNISAVFTERQTAGRGQFNRAWLSGGFGENIALSILYHLPNLPGQLNGLSLVIGIAVARALQEYGLKEIKLKWPNDILYTAKKLAGVLIEIKKSPHANHFATVIGVGLNLYSPMNLHTINQAVTDIYSIQKSSPQRNRLAGLLLKNCLLILAEFQRFGFVAFKDEWSQFDCLKGKRVQIETANKLRQGIARSVNAQGQLCIEIDAESHCFNSGEVCILQC